MKKKIFTLLVILSSLITHHSSAQVLCIYCYDQNDSISHGVHNLIQNGGFENTTCIPSAAQNRSFCPNSSYYDCDIANWTCSGGGNSTYANTFDTNQTKIIEGTRAAYFGNRYATACLTQINCTYSGVSLCYPINTDTLQYGAVGVSLQQTVSGLVVSNTYVLEFWAGGEYGGFFPNDGIFALDIGFGDTILRNKPTQTYSGIGRRYIVQFIAVSDTHTIKFTNWGHICSSCTELVLDDVKLYTIGELSETITRCTNGITEIHESSISIYPNPTGNVLSVKTNDKERLGIVVYDITSRKLLSQDFTGSTDINIESLAKGIYLYQIINNQGIIKNGKIVKE